MTFAEKLEAERAYWDSRGGREFTVPFEAGARAALELAAEQATESIVKCRHTRIVTADELRRLASEIGARP